jgi:hypothetical protein
MTDGTSDNNKSSLDPSEPSMEDILASIRQLIADDDVPGGAIISADEVPLDTEELSAPEKTDFASSDTAAFVEPFELTNILDVAENIPAAAAAPIAASMTDVPIPEIDIEAVPLTSSGDLDDEIDLPVQSLIDDIMGVDVEASLEDVKPAAEADADIETALNELISDVDRGSDESQGSVGAQQDQPNVAALDIEGLFETGETDVPGIDAADIDVDNELMGDLLPAQGDDAAIEPSIDDILNDLSNELDMSAPLETKAEVDVETETKTEIDVQTGDVEELGQDFDSLMAEFTAGDDIETGLDSLVETSPDDLETASFTANVAAGDAPSTDAEIGHLIDDLMANETLGSSVDDAADDMRAHQSRAALMGALIMSPLKHLMKHLTPISN